ncbi:MAG: hypothetical protein B6229_01490 [Spirochaetaceae bacterium 4572_7]|nr:MAG: hypothetical protein B6229_01490 [Spirochaetaceae bacterium 4572_7]
MKIRRRLKRTAVADMTPMIDIIFQLVIFFMISSVFNTAPGIDIDLPKGEATQLLDITPLTITVRSNNEIYLNKEVSTLDNFSNTLTAYKNGLTDPVSSVVLKGDKDISYGTFIEIMGKLRAAGFDKINMITNISRSKGE